MTPIGNLFAGAAPSSQDERFDPLLRCRNLVIERIVSPAGIAPATYEQPQDEWVVLLRGSATLCVAGARHQLGPGDYLFLPAGVPHTVEAIAEECLWLAVHLHP